jgi:hemoglobin
MRRLSDHQTKSFAQLMGGPESHSSDHLERIHARLGITNEAFREAALLLRETPEDMEFEDEDVQMVEDEFVSRKPFIVSRGVTHVAG